MTLPSFLKPKKKIPVKIVMTGIICLTILEVVALMNGVNGVVLTMVVASITLAIGVIIPTPKQLK